MKRLLAHLIEPSTTNNDVLTTVNGKTAWAAPSGTSGGGVFKGEWVAPVSYSAAVQADAPLAYYRQSESGGSALTDTSGNNHGGAYSGTYTLGQPGLLVGSTDTSVRYAGGYAQVPYGSWMDAAAFTVEAIIKPDAASTDQAIITRSISSKADFRFHVYQDGSLRLGVFNGTAFTELASAAGLIVGGTTYHVVATWASGVGKLYVNGSLVATGNLTRSITNGPPLMIAGEFTSGSFTGILDEAAYYGIALPDTRITAHYNASVTSPTGLAYANGDFVTYNGYLWRSTIANNSATPGIGSAWVAVSVSHDIQDLANAKGDLLVATGDNTLARLPVSALNGQVLTVDATQASGMKWADPPTGSGGSGASTTGSDTTKQGNSTAVGNGATGTLVSTTTITPTADTLLTIVATGNASSSSNQGAYLTPQVTYVFNGDTLQAAGSAVTQNQVVRNPLSNTPLEGSATVFLKAGKTYTLGYQLKAGTGGSTVTFTNVQCTYRLTPL